MIDTNYLLLILHLVSGVCGCHLMYHVAVKYGCRGLKLCWKVGAEDRYFDALVPLCTEIEHLLHECYPYKWPKDFSNFIQPTESSQG